jgi:hypothetical protein
MSTVALVPIALPSIKLKRSFREEDLSRSTPKILKPRIQEYILPA